MRKGDPLQINGTFQHHTGDFMMTGCKTKEDARTKRLSHQSNRLTGKSLLAEPIECISISRQRAEVRSTFIGIKSLVAKEDDIKAIVQEESVIVVGVSDS